MARAPSEQEPSSLDDATAAVTPQARGAHETHETHGSRDGREASDAAEPALRVSAGFALPPALASLQPLLKRIVWLLPWASLASGVFGAFMMDRSPKSAWLIAVAAIAIWLALFGMRFVARIARPDRIGTRKLLLTTLELSLLLAGQALMQLTLFFALPFFFYAAAFDLGHIFFLLLLSAISAASLWDPWTERLLRDPLLSAAFAAFGSFAALTAVLPALGLSTQVSLWLAIALASLGFPLLTVASFPPDRRLRPVLSASLLALLFPALMYFGGTRVVPAAPLRLVRIELGTQLTGKWVTAGVTELESVPTRLFCSTAVASPLNLHDRLFHVWRKDGAPRGRIELDIIGGRHRGYRTHSRIKPNGAGKYTCTVETATGQVLGARSVRISGR